MSILRVKWSLFPFPDEVNRLVIVWPKYLNLHRLNLPIQTC
jgi:hypothetical protein